MKRFEALLLLPLLAACAACAARGPYPSLEPRPAEALYASGDPVAPAPVHPDRPEVAQTVAGLLSEGRTGDGAFEEALAAARPLAQRAGGYGSESWVAAQQALSRVEAARAATIRALADLDSFAVREAAAGPLSAADYERLTVATAELQRLANDQQMRLNALRTALTR